MKGDPGEQASGHGDGFPVSGAPHPSALPESTEWNSEHAAMLRGVSEQAPEGWLEVADAVWFAAHRDRSVGSASAPEPLGQGGLRPPVDMPLPVNRRGIEDVWRPDALPAPAPLAPDSGTGPESDGPVNWWTSHGCYPMRSGTSRYMSGRCCGSTAAYHRMLPAVPPCSRVPCSDACAVFPRATPWNWTRRPSPNRESSTICGCPSCDPPVPPPSTWSCSSSTRPPCGSGRTSPPRLARAAEHSGVFWGVRTVQVNVSRSGTAPLQRPTGPAAADPAELLDGRGGCVFLVVTDGLAHGLASPGADDLLGWLAHAGPTVVAHLLPPHLRHRSSLYPYQAVLEASGFGATDDSVPVPVLSLKPGSVAAWADLVAGERGVRRELLVVLADTLIKGAPASSLHTSGVPRAAKVAVRRSLTFATPLARRVATQLAAIPFDFDLVEQLRRRTMPETGSDHLAEILMGGLIDWGGGGEGRPEFADGVREELFAVTTRSQLAYTIRAVGGLPAAGERGVAMHAALRDPMGTRPPELEEPGGARSELAVMHAPSGPYSEREKRVGLLADTPAEVNRTTERVSSGDGEGRDPASTVADQSGELVPSQVTDVTEHKAPKAEPFMQSTTTATPALLVNVPLRNTSFVGQQALLRAVEEQLGAQHTAAVLPHGLGGVGKSQLALAYVYTHQHDYRVIWWIPAERESLILAALASLVAQLGVAPTGQDSQGAPAANAVVPAVLEALRTGALYDDWLLVFGNAQDVEAVRNSFPTSGRSKAIVASRNRAWERVATRLPVNVFECQETIELPRQRSPDRSAEGEDRLADALSHPPLAVYKPSPAYTVPMSEGVAMTTPE